MGTGVKMGWLDASRSSVVCRLDEWTSWTQLRDSLAQYQQIAASLNPPPHLIYYFCDDLRVPQPWAMPQLRAFMLQNTPGTHRTVFVNAPRVLKVFVRMTQQAYADLTDVDDEYIFVDTLDEALAQLGLHGDEVARR